MAHSAVFGKSGAARHRAQSLGGCPGYFEDFEPGVAWHPGVGAGVRRARADPGMTAPGERDCLTGQVSGHREPAGGHGPGSRQSTVHQWSVRPCVSRPAAPAGNGCSGIFQLSRLRFPCDRAAAFLRSGRPGNPVQRPDSRAASRPRSMAEVAARTAKKIGDGPSAGKIRGAPGGRAAVVCSAVGAITGKRVRSHAPTVPIRFRAYHESEIRQDPPYSDSGAGSGRRIGPRGAGGHCGRLRVSGVPPVFRQVRVCPTVFFGR